MASFVAHLHVSDRTCEDRNLEVDVVAVARQHGGHEACHCAVVSYVEKRKDQIHTPPVLRGAIVG